jgi:hypothetical protein
VLSSISVQSSGISFPSSCIAFFTFSMDRAAALTAELARIEAEIDRLKGIRDGKLLELENCKIIKLKK